MPLFEIDIDHRRDKPRELRGIVRECRCWRRAVVVERAYRVHHATEVGGHFVRENRQPHGRRIRGIRKRRDLRDQVRLVIRVNVLQRESFAPHHDNVETSIGEHFDVRDFGNAPRASRWQRLLGDPRNSAHDSETAIRVTHVSQQLPIARFKEMQRDRNAREQDQADWKEREARGGHRNRNLWCAPELSGTMRSALRRGDVRQARRNPWPAATGSQAPCRAARSPTWRER